jgi:hypothetical protein
MPDTLTREEIERLRRSWEAAPGGTTSIKYGLQLIAHIDALAAANERLTRALRVATHSPHDQKGEPNEGFPTCSECGAIQTGGSPTMPDTPA